MRKLVRTVLKNQAYNHRYSGYTFHMLWEDWFQKAGRKHKYFHGKIRKVTKSKYRRKRGK